jgi:hypothetical protein
MSHELPPSEGETQAACGDSKARSKQATIGFI